ncbi:tetratricopeptide repeat protein [Bacillus daqingensis]|uniref:Tetratricopeptide repeat protein n=1 Tax=Bacillus daqingensis TaxID=872396 RepID=A0ABV9NVR0_9BACI
MTKEENRDNVVLFPGLISRLVERGMQALKEKRYYDALSCFQQTTDLEPNHPQARYGMVITNIELNRMEQAESHCRSMLDEGVGDYYEILQVYISILVQLGDYEEVVHMLESVMEEDRLPSDKAEHFYQLLSFARQMTETPIHKSQDAEFELPRGELVEQLEKGTVDQQLGAIQQLSKYDVQAVKETYSQFLADPQQNPVLKSYILQLLKELDCTDTFEVYKFGETYEVDINRLEAVFHEQFGKAVFKELEQELDQENPSMLDMIGQMWWHFLFALYPKSPRPIDAPVWAAALHATARRMFGEDPGDVTALYGAEEADVKQAEELLRELESIVLPSEEGPT